MAILETQAFIQSVKKTKNDNYFVRLSYLTGRTVNGKKSKQYIDCLATKKMKSVIADTYESLNVKEGKEIHKYSGEMLSIKIRDPHFYIFEGDMKASLQSSGLLLSLEPVETMMKMAILESQAFIHSVKKTKNDNYFVTFSYLTGKLVKGKKSKQYISCLASKKMKSVIAEIYESINVKEGKEIHKYSGKMLSIKIGDPDFYIFEGDIKASLQSSGLLLSLEPFEPIK